MAAALAIVPAAKADTFYFNVSGSGLAGGGSLTGNWIAGGFNITGGNIVFNGFTATVIGDPTPGSIANWYPQGGWSWGPWTYDNLLVNGAGLQPDQVGGILFAYQGGALELWCVGTTVYYNEWTPANGWLFPLTGEEGEPLAVNISSTPEPSSLLLLGTGLLGLVGLVFWKSRSRTVNSAMGLAV